MKNILFLNDYGDHAKYIYQYALRIGQHFDATINSVHIFTAPNPIIVSDGGEDYYERFEEDRERQFEEETERLRFFISQQTPKQSHDLIGDFHVREGNKANEILDIIEKEKIDLLVLGMNQQNKLANALFGNLSLQMIDKAHCPVLLVPRKSSYLGINDIVFAADLKVHDFAAVNYVAEWAKAFKASLHVIHAALSYSDHVHAVKDIEIWKLRFDKEIAAGEIKFYLLVGDVKENIEEFVNEIDADLVCLSTHIRGFWAHLLEPSITKDIARKVSVPVLVLKPANR